MTEDTALKILINQAKQRIENIFTEGRGSGMINFCFKELFEYSEIQEWISVKNRLPEPYLKVKVKAKGETDWVSYMYPNKTWMNNDQPTHWMPLNMKDDK